MSVSHRLSLVWAPIPPNLFPSAQLFESAIVITGEEYFIDLRLNTADGTLSWAFAGTKSVEHNSPLAAGYDEHLRVVQSSWVHLLDSRLESPNCEQALVISPHPDHRNQPNLSLERGFMHRDPHRAHDGLQTAYEEVWEDEALPRGSLVEFFERPHTSSSTRAFVGRVGNMALGIGYLDGSTNVWCWKAKWTTSIPKNSGGQSRSRALDQPADAENNQSHWEGEFPVGQPIEEMIGLDLLSHDPSANIQNSQSRAEVGSVRSSAGVDWVVRESWSTWIM